MEDSFFVYSVGRARVRLLFDAMPTIKTISVYACLWIFPRHSFALAHRLMFFAVPSIFHPARSTFIAQWASIGINASFWQAAILPPPGIAHSTRLHREEKYLCILLLVYLLVSLSHHQPFMDAWAWRARGSESVDLGDVIFASTSPVIYYIRHIFIDLAHIKKIADYQHTNPPPPTLPSLHPICSTQCAHTLHFLRQCKNSIYSCVSKIVLICLSTHRFYTWSSNADKIPPEKHSRHQTYTYKI